MKISDEMVNRFLSWPVPDSVCVDGNCARQGQPGDSRIGTNLLTFVEARAMLEHVAGPALDAMQAKIDALMLEYCQDEMTPEQIEEWGRHQVAVEHSSKDSAKP